METALGVAAEELDTTATPWKYHPTQHKNLAKGLPLTVLVGPRARAALAPFLAGKETGLIFSGRSVVPGVRYSGPRQYSGYAAALATACKSAQIPHYTPRQIRHTTAEWLVARGVPEAIIGAILGHSGTGTDSSLRAGSGTITGRYAMVPRRRVEAIIEKWG